MKRLYHFRDWMKEDRLKYLPGSMVAGTFIMLKDSEGGKIDFTPCDKCKEWGFDDTKLCDDCKPKHKKVLYETKPWQQVLHVFDKTGTFIGTIQEPEFMPFQD